MTHRFKTALLTLLVPLFGLKVTGQSIKLNADSAKNKYRLPELVVSASRKFENILCSPVSIEKVSRSGFELSAAPSFFEALENVKGVQLITPSLGFKIINTRGFANTTNVRFTQLVDGIDNMAPHLGAPIGDAMGPSDLDIESIEIIPGTASALYGLNALNGLANFITRDPFKSAGISLQQKVGLNHVNDDESRAKLFSETSFRIANILSPHFALKFNGTYTRGQDWIANNRTDLNSSANTQLGISGGVGSPAYDPVNGYGNESSDRKTLTLQGKQYVISRTGYFEKEVTSYTLRNIKADVALVYLPDEHTRLTYTYRFADLDNIYQRANRFRLKDYLLQQHAIEFKTPVLEARAYWTHENTGKSYNLRSAAENQDRNFKPDAAWYDDFSKEFGSAVGAGANVQQALLRARASADAGRYQPGTEPFASTLSKLSEVNNWDIGSALRVKDELFHVEGQFDLTKISGSKLLQRIGLGITGGADHRTYLIHPDGNYFVNYAPGRPLSNFAYARTGGFIQASESLFGDRLILGAILRTDRNDFSTIKFNPRVTAVYAPSNNNHFRLSYQSGYRFASIFEAFSNVNSGGVKRIGGLKVVSSGVFENSYLRTSIDRFQAAVKDDFNNGIAMGKSIPSRTSLLVKNPYTYLNPEHINSFEVGYKKKLPQQSLSLDVDFYYNKYDQFIAQVEINVPNTTSSDSIPYYLNNKSKQTRYRAWTNSQSIVYNYGASLGLVYRPTETIYVTGNASYAKLQRTSHDDALEDGFNTPQWIGNLSFGDAKILKYYGFNVNYKWQSGYYWQSFLVNGNVKSYGTLDAQVNRDFFASKINLKVGATNLANKYYYSFLGGPSIGGFYYTTVTVHIE